MNTILTGILIGMIICLPILLFVARGKAHPLKHNAKDTNCPCENCQLSNEWSDALFYVAKNTLTGWALAPPMCSACKVNRSMGFTADGPRVFGNMLGIEVSHFCIKCRPQLNENKS